MTRVPSTRREVRPSGESDREEGGKAGTAETQKPASSRPDSSALRRIDDAHEFGGSETIIVRQGELFPASAPPDHANSDVTAPPPKPRTEKTTRLEPPQAENEPLTDRSAEPNPDRAPEQVLRHEPAQATAQDTIQHDTVVQDAIQQDGMRLVLNIADPELQDALRQFDTTAERNDYAITALKIGAAALKVASGRLDAETIRNESRHLLSQVSQQLESHSRTVHDRRQHATAGILRSR